MRIGFSIPARGPLANTADIRALAEQGEAMGFDHLAVPDHIVVPKAIDSDYPYTATGEFPGSATGDALDQFTVMAFLAAITRRMRLLSSVTVVPHRGAVQTAKILSTLDVMSEGRVIFGVGAGWMREEFEAVGAPDFDARGRVTDEYIEACKVLWTDASPAYAGNYVSFRNISFLPRPIQSPSIPIWVGGESKAAMRRTVKYGDAWYPIGLNPRHLMNTPERLRGGIERLHRIAASHDRDPASIGLTLFHNSFKENEEVMTDSGERQLLSGSASALCEDIAALAALGITDLVLNFQRDSIAASLDAMAWFVSNVRDRL